MILAVLRLHYVIPLLFAFDISTKTLVASGEDQKKSKKETERVDLFHQANKRYKERKFRGAMELYQKITHKSAAVNYNLGNCAYQLDQNGYALLYWRRAQRQGGFFMGRELAENISLVQKKVGVGYQDTKTFAFVRHIKQFALSLVRALPLWLLQVFFLFLWLILFFGLRFLYKKRQKFLIFTLFALNAFVGILLLLHYTYALREEGVVIAKSVSLRSGPEMTFPVLGEVPEGMEVVIKRESGDFYKVKVYRQIGWVHRSTVEKI